MHVDAIRRYALAFSTITYSHSTIHTRFCGCPFLNRSDARTHLPRIPVPIFVRTCVGWKLYCDTYRIYRPAKYSCDVSQI